MNDKTENTKYLIKSVSEEGEYFLCNGWERHKTFWCEKREFRQCLFNTVGQAKASLTKLLKSMDDYAQDKFSVYSFTEADGLKKLYDLPQAA